MFPTHFQRVTENSETLDLGPEAVGSNLQNGASSLRGGVGWGTTLGLPGASREMNHRHSPGLNRYLLHQNPVSGFCL